MSSKRLGESHLITKMLKNGFIYFGMTTLYFVENIIALLWVIPSNLLAVR